MFGKKRKGTTKAAAQDAPSTTTPKRSRSSSKRQQGIIDKIFGTRDGESPRLAWWWLWRKVILEYNQMKDSRTFPVRSRNLYTNDRALFSGKENMSVVLSIDGYSAMLPLEFRAAVRDRLHPSMRVSFISNSIPTRIEWSSPEMQARMRNYRSRNQEIEELGDDVFDYQVNMSALDKNAWLKESIYYLANADGNKRNRQLFDFRSFMIVTGVRGEDFDDALEKIIKFCEKNGLTVNRITRHLGSFLSSFSPTSLDFNAQAVSSVGKNVLPDEIIARFSGYDQGRIGREGIVISKDIESGYPILKKFKKDDVDAENILVLAETGGGKSYAVKIMIISLAAQPRVRLTIMDVEGAEYLPLVDFFNNQDSTVVLNMAEGQGSYFDPVSIVTTGDEALDRAGGVFSLSKSYTLVFFRTLVGDQVMSTNPWASNIIDAAVAKTYMNAGVLESDYSTWSRSADLTLHSIYQVIKQDHLTLAQERARLVRASSYTPDDFRVTNEEYCATLDLVRAQLARYFETPEHGGILSSIFSNRVSIDEVANSKIVLCSFGMESRSSVQVDPIQMNLAQLSAANISHIRSLYCKREGKFNVKVWEELQRWASFPGSREILSVAITGGRKMGDINFMIGNDPSLFMGAAASLNVFSNVTSFCIGAIADAPTRAEIAKSLSVEELLPDLDALVLKAGDTETFNTSSTTSAAESPYRRAFLIKLDKSVVTIGKVDLPEFIAKSELLRTGSIESLDADTLTDVTSEGTIIDYDAEDLSTFGGDLDSLLTSARSDLRSLEAQSYDTEDTWGVGTGFLESDVTNTGAAGGDGDDWDLE